MKTKYHVFECYTMLKHYFSMGKEGGMLRISCEYVANIMGCSEWCGAAGDGNVGNVGH